MPSCIDITGIAVTFVLCPAKPVLNVEKTGLKQARNPFPAGIYCIPAIPERTKNEIGNSKTDAGS
jgi:hypothetical protein